MSCFFLDIDYLRISAFFRNKKQPGFTHSYREISKICNHKGPKTRG